MSSIVLDKTQPHKVSISGLPVKLTIYSAFDHNLERIESVHTDLLVLTELEHMRLGPGPARFDALLDSAISKALAEDHFSGRLGNSLLIKTDNAKIREVVVVGIGKPAAFGRPSLCGLFRLVFEQAVASGAKKVTIPVFPGRLTDINLKGTAAVLRCKILQLASEGLLGSIEEVEILTSPQATRHFLLGLQVEEPLCRVCRNPRIN